MAPGWSTNGFVRRKLPELEAVSRAQNVTRTSNSAAAARLRPSVQDHALGASGIIASVTLLHPAGRTDYAVSPCGDCIAYRAGGSINVTCTDAADLQVVATADVG